MINFDLQELKEEFLRYSKDKKVLDNSKKFLKEYLVKTLEKNNNNKYFNIDI